MPPYLSPQLQNDFHTFALSNIPTFLGMWERHRIGPPCIPLPTFALFASFAALPPSAPTTNLVSWPVKT